MCLRFTIVDSPPLRSFGWNHLNYHVFLFILDPSLVFACVYSPSVAFGSFWWFSFSWFSSLLFGTSSFLSSFLGTSFFPSLLLGSFSFFPFPFFRPFFILSFPWLPSRFGAFLFLETLFKFVPRAYLFLKFPFWVSWSDAINFPWNCSF